MPNSYNVEGANNYSSANIRKIELQNAHEQVQLKEEHEHEARMAELRYSNERTIKDGEHQHEETMYNQSLGKFGRLFGSKENSSRNITGTICLSFIAGATLVSLIVYFFKEDLTFVKYMWSVTSPIITLSLGYLFGKK